MVFSHHSFSNFITFTLPIFISIEVLSVATIMLSVKYKRSIRCSVSLPDTTWLTDSVCTSSERFKRHTTPAFGSATRICSFLGEPVQSEMVEILHAPQ